MVNTKKKKKKKKRKVIYGNACDLLINIRQITTLSRTEKRLTSIKLIGVKISIRPEHNCSGRV